MRSTRFTGVVTYSCIPSGNSMTTTEPFRGARTSRPATARAPFPSLRNTTSTRTKVASRLAQSTARADRPAAARGGRLRRNPWESPRKAPSPHGRTAHDTETEMQSLPTPHRTGWIEVVCGSMFSGKTEEVLRRVKRARLARQRVLLFKPRVDNRYDEVKVVSHEGDNADAIPVSSAAELASLVSPGTAVVGIDEV